MAGLLVEDRNYTLSEVFLSSKTGLPISLSASTVKKIQKSRDTLTRVINSGKTVYGVNTGFGKLSQVKISPQQLTLLQRNLLLSHAVGVGDPTPDEIVHLMMLLKVLSLSRGYSGVRVELVEKLMEIMNAGCIPVVPQQGSVGASGDLAPLSHMSLPLINEGELKMNGKSAPSSKLLKTLKISPIDLQFKEGLALINGTQFSTAYGVHCLHRLQDLVKIADIAGAISTEGLMGTDSAFLEKVQMLKPHPGQKQSAENLYQLLQDSEIHHSHKDCDRVQDMYSLRCIPQVHGACRDSISAAVSMIENEFNSVSDNPLVFPDEEVISAGNFHAESAAQALDIAAIAATELGNISERRIFSLTKGDFGLPPFLVDDPGINSGVMMCQVTAAALTSENKGLSHPASVDNISTGADQEDHVSMAPWAGRKLYKIVKNLENILAIEILCSCQAIEYREGLTPAAGVKCAFDTVRKKITKLKNDRILENDIRTISSLINSGEFLSNVEKKIKLN